MADISRLTTSVMRSLAALAAVLLAAGCAGPARLAPAPGADVLPGHGYAALAQEGGVRLTVVANAWRGHPDNLADEITPLKVTIENRGTQPLRIRYNEFALEAPQGVRHTALPPLKITGSVEETSALPEYVPRFMHSDFYMAPYYHPLYGAVPIWEDPWAYDTSYYDRYYPTWRIQLPTQDMRDMAIPEGVLKPGGEVSGFVYFPKIERDAKALTFAFDLRSPGADADFGRLRIPFVVE